MRAFSRHPMLSPRPAPRGASRGASRGFTLVEVMIGMFISAVIFLAGFMILKGASNVRSASLQRVAVADNARVFFALLKREIAAAGPGPWDPAMKKEDFGGPDYKTIAVTTHSDPYFQRSLLYQDADDKLETAPAYVSVRYSVDGAGRLKREVSFKAVEYDENGDPLDDDKTTIFDADAPTVSETLFGDVKELRVYFLRWNEADKRLEQVPEGLGEENTATHLNVELKLFLSEKTADKDAERDAEGKPFRTFSCLFEIPAAFTE